MGSYLGPSTRSTDLLGALAAHDRFLPLLDIDFEYGTSWLHDTHPHRDLDVAGLARCYPYYLGIRTFAGAATHVVLARLDIDQEPSIGSQCAERPLAHGHVD